MSKERKKLVKDLDAAVSLYIRTRDNFKCFTCGVTNKTHIIQCGHLFSRASFSTRWDELNCHAQCQPCNWYHEEHAERYTYAFLKKYGQEKYEMLYAKYSQSTKFSESDLKELIKYYKNKLKEVSL